MKKNLNFNTLKNILIRKNSNAVEKLPTKVINNDFTEFENHVIEEVKDYTMTSAERIVSLIRAVEYLNYNNIKGDYVECGVWKGGSIAACLLTLIKLSNEEAKIWLYDTFEGMNEPTDHDLDLNGKLASERMFVEDQETSWLWAKADLDLVKRNVKKFGYPQKNIEYVKGMVETTLTLDRVPEKISFLRIDTDWYESTKIELEVLYPKLVSGGVLIIDDYGHWGGCRKAVDEYFENQEFKPFFSRIDYTGRIIIKP
jgi:hypothetical protein